MWLLMMGWPATFSIFTYVLTLPLDVTSCCSYGSPLCISQIAISGLLHAVLVWSIASEELSVVGVPLPASYFYLLYKQIPFQHSLKLLVYNIQFVACSKPNGNRIVAFL